MQQNSFNNSSALNLNSTADGTNLCANWQEPNHYLYHLANVVFILASMAPVAKKGFMFMHGGLALGFILLAAWSLLSVCAATVLIWALITCAVNTAQVLYTLHKMRQVRFEMPLETLYKIQFEPLRVPREAFAELLSSEAGARLATLHCGELYAVENVTRADRLGLLLSGRCHVICQHQFLYPVTAMQFLDAPEFGSFSQVKEPTHRVTIVCAQTADVIIWERDALSYVLIRNQRLRSVMQALTAYDTLHKLQTMLSDNKKVHAGPQDLRVALLTAAEQKYQPIGKGDF